MKYLLFICVFSIFGLYNFQDSTLNEQGFETESLPVQSVQISQPQFNSFLGKVETVQQTLRERSLTDEDIPLDEVINKLKSSQVDQQTGNYNVDVNLLANVITILKVYESLSHHNDDYPKTIRKNKIRKVQTSTGHHHHEHGLTNNSERKTKEHHHHKDKKSRRKLHGEKAKNNAVFEDVPNLISLVGGINGVYNEMFQPINNSNNGTSTYQQAIYYLSMYSTVRNFALAFAANKAQIEKDLKVISNSTTGNVFNKNEILEFFGYLDLYESLKLTVHAQQTPFLAQDQQLTIICSKFTTIFEAINYNINFILSQHKVLTDATNYLTSSKDSIANPTIQDLKTIDEALVLVPKILSIYTNLQNTIGDLQTQLQLIQTTKTMLQTSFSNMQLIVSGQALAKSSAFQSTFTILLSTFIFGMFA